MDIQAYIDSGILESYALGTATDFEKNEVEKNVALYPQLAHELALIQKALEQYALLHEKEAPAGLEQKIKTTIFNETKTQSINSQAKKSWPVAASWVLLALSLGANLFFWNKWQKTETSLENAIAQNAELAKNENILKANYNSKLAALENALFKKVIMKGTAEAPEALATIYFNKQSNEVYLGSMKMPSLPAGKQYQLWAIVNGKPVNAGLIDEADTLGKMNLIANAQAFAISIENTGGSTTEKGPLGAVLVSGGV